MPIYLSIHLSVIYLFLSEKFACVYEVWIYISKTPGDAKLIIHSLGGL